ncbi:MAG: potassium-transporting ATPase subunit B, partial [Candidatus Binatus sp.]
MSDRKAPQLWNSEIVSRAAIESFIKLDPRLMIRNPVMFVVEVTSVMVMFTLFRDTLARRMALAGFEFQIALWLWFTVLFANFAEAMAEGRGKAQADNLRKTRTETQAKLIVEGGQTKLVPAAQLRRGDIVMVAAGDVIPGDGEIIEGIAAVNEAAITGESAPVIRESGGDRSGVTGGTTVISDWIKVKITANPGETFLDRMIALVEGAHRQKTPNEIALSILLS